MDSVPLNRSPAWLIGRAVLALTLFIGFYVLAVGIAGGLLWIPYAELVYLERIDPRIAFVCIGAGGAILWSLRPASIASTRRGRGCTSSSTHGSVRRSSRWRARRARRSRARSTSSPR